ncbi:MAG: EI24 domain-containing protein [Fimbriimonadaceae bacterium]
MEYLVSGIRMTLTQRDLRAFIIRPLLWGILIYAFVAVSANFALAGPLQDFIHRMGVPDKWSFWVARIAFFIAWSFIAGPIFFGINGMLSSVLWDKLSLRVEQQVFGGAPDSKTTLGRSLLDSLARLPLTIGVAILSAILGFTPLAWLTAWPVGWLSLYDFTACAYARRGLYYPSQKAASSRLPKAREFAICCGILSLIPLLNLICLPGCIAGATILVRKGESA